MKKSLVALAALAVVGAASAQVSITGTTSFSYQSSLTGTYGIAMSDDSIFLGDTEDLGGGNKLVMSTGFDAGGRTQTGGGAFGSENSSLTLSGGFGAVKLVTYESDGPFAAVNLSGASLAVGLFDSNAVGNAKRYRNAVSYSAPSFNGVTAALTYVTLAGQYVQNDSNGAKTKVVPAVTYKTGALTVYAEDAIFNASYNSTLGNVGPGDVDNTITQPTVTAMYDFGAAQVGAGWTKASNDGAVWILSASVPVGALTFGVATSSYTPGGNSGFLYTNAAGAQPYNNGAATWTEASVGYALSKRTSLKASFGATNDAGVSYANNFGVNAAGAKVGTGVTNYGTTGGLVQNSQYRVGLFHSF